MSLTIDRPALWISMPGWAIAADLTPPELIQARRFKAWRRLLAAGMVALLLTGGYGYYLAAAENTSATRDLAAVQDRTSELLAVGHGYSDVVAIQGTVGDIRLQLAQVMAADVDLATLLTKLHGNLPETMTITQETVTISEAGAAGAAAESQLEISGSPRIGTITLSGTGHTMDDLPDYIDRLRAVTGLVDVLPVSNSINSAGGTEFSMTAGLTDAILSHRFDVGR